MPLGNINFVPVTSLIVFPLLNYKLHVWDAHEHEFVLFFSLIKKYWLWFCILFSAFECVTPDEQWPQWLNVGMTFD